MKVKKTKKQLECKVCGDLVNNVGSEATAVTCWKCVNKMVNGIVENNNNN